MGNSESNESAAVKRQAEGGANPMYSLLDLSGEHSWTIKFQFLQAALHRSHGAGTMGGGVNPTDQKTQKKYTYSVQGFRFLKMLTDIWNCVHMEEFWRTF
jgi:hypothetical protein